MTDDVSEKLQIKSEETGKSDSHAVSGNCFTLYADCIKTLASSKLPTADELLYGRGMSIQITLRDEVTLL